MGQQISIETITVNRPVFQKLYICSRWISTTQLAHRLVSVN